MAEHWVPWLAERTTAPIHRYRQTVRARTATDLFLGRGRPGHGEIRLSDGPIQSSWFNVERSSQVGPLGRRSLQQLAARTALSGTNRVFYCRVGHCARPPAPQPALGPQMASTHPTSGYCRGYRIAGFQIACRNRRLPRVCMTVSSTAYACMH